MGRQSTYFLGAGVLVIFVLLNGHCDALDDTPKWRPTDRTLGDFLPSDNASDSDLGGGSLSGDMTGAETANLDNTEISIHGLEIPSLENLRASIRRGSSSDHSKSNSYSQSDSSSSDDGDVEEELCSSSSTTRAELERSMLSLSDDHLEKDSDDEITLEMSSEDWRRSHVPSREIPVATATFSNVVSPEEYKVATSIRMFPGTTRMLSKAARTYASFDTQADENGIFSHYFHHVTNLFARAKRGKLPFRKLKVRQLEIDFPKRVIRVTKLVEKTRKGFGGKNVKYYDPDEVKEEIPLNAVSRIEKVPDTFFSKDCFKIHYEKFMGEDWLGGLEESHIRLCIDKYRKDKTKVMDGLIEMMQYVIKVDKQLVLLKSFRWELGDGLATWYERKFDEPLLVEVDNEGNVEPMGPGMCYPNIRKIFGAAPDDAIAPPEGVVRHPHLQQALEECESAIGFENCEGGECSCLCHVLRKEHYPVRNMVTDWVYKRCRKAELSYFGLVRPSATAKQGVNVPVSAIILQRKSDNSAAIPIVFVRYFNYRNWKRQDTVPEELRVAGTSFSSLDPKALVKELTDGITYVKAFEGGTSAGRNQVSAFSVTTSAGNNYVVKVVGNNVLLSALGHLLGMITPRIANIRVPVDDMTTVLDNVLHNGDCNAGASMMKTQIVHFAKGRSDIFLSVQDLAFGAQKESIPNFGSVLTSAEQVGLIAAFDFLISRSDLFYSIDQESFNNIIGAGSATGLPGQSSPVANIDMNWGSYRGGYLRFNKAFLSGGRTYRSTVPEQMYSMFKQPTTMAPFVDLSIGAEFFKTCFLPCGRRSVDALSYKTGMMIQLGIIEFAIRLLENEEVVTRILSEAEPSLRDHIVGNMELLFKFADGPKLPEKVFSLHAERKQLLPPVSNPLEGWKEARRRVVDVICAAGVPQTPQIKHIEEMKPEEGIYVAGFVNDGIL